MQPDKNVACMIFTDSEFFCIVEFTLADFRHAATVLQLPFAKKTMESERAKVAVLCLFVWVLIASVFFSRAEAWTYFDSIYFAIVTLSTVGLGDFVPLTVEGVLFTFLFELVRLELMVLTIFAFTEWWNKRKKRLGLELRAAARSTLVASESLTRAESKATIFCYSKCKPRKRAASETYAEEASA